MLASVVLLRFKILGEAYAAQPIKIRKFSCYNFDLHL